jgi:hypothetical protein
MSDTLPPPPDFRDLKWKPLTEFGAVSNRIVAYFQ